MPTFSRYTATKTAPVDPQDEEEYRRIAEAKLATKEALPTASPPTPAASNLSKVTQPPAQAPAVSTDAGRAADLRKEALGRLDAEPDQAAQESARAARVAALGPTTPTKPATPPAAVAPANANVGSLALPPANDTRTGLNTRVDPVTGQANGTGQGLGGGIHVNGPGNHYNDDGTAKYQDDVQLPTAPRAPTPVAPTPKPPVDGHTVIDPHMPPPGTLGPAKGLPPADEAGLADVARARLNAQETEATRAELAAGKAKALMMANARAQLAGMGLGGGTAALESDIGRTQDRSAVLAMSQLGRNQRDETRADRRITADETAAAANQKRAETNDAWLQIQRKEALDLMEEQDNADLDGDGDIAGRVVGGGTRRTPDEVAADRTDSEQGIADNFMGQQLSDIPRGNTADHPRGYFINPDDGTATATDTGYFYDPQDKHFYRSR